MTKPATLRLKSRMKPQNPPSWPSPRTSVEISPSVSMPPIRKQMPTDSPVREGYYYTLRTGLSKALS